MEWRLHRGTTDGVDVGAPIDQKLDARLVAPERGLVQRTPAVCVVAVDIGQAVQQRSHRIHIAFVGCIEQLAVELLLVHRHRHLHGLDWM